MRILALTDIHGAYKKAEEIIRKEPADILIIGGDLTTVGSVKEVENAISRFQSLSHRLLCVAGNMDLPQHDDVFTKLGVSINGCGMEIDGVGFFGVSAAPLSPLSTPYEITEEEMAKRITTGFKQIEKCSVSFFVPHAPPYGTRVDIIHAGYHAGSTAVRDFIDDEQPDLVICGHIHEGRGEDLLGKSKIVNSGAACDGYYSVIEVNQEIRISFCRLPL